MKAPSRLGILSIALLLVFGTPLSKSQEAAQPAAAVLMVCEHGNVKSLMAASFFNELAKARHLPFHAIARARRPIQRPFHHLLSMACVRMALTSPVFIPLRLPRQTWRPPSE